MATENTPVCLSFPAAGDLSADQYKAVELGSAGTVSVANAAGEPVIGILQDKPGAAGRVAQVAVGGVSKVLAGTGGIDEGQYVKTAADGRIVVAAAGTTNTSDAGAASDPLVGSHVLGICVEAAVAGAIGSILITHAGAVPTTAA
ncbi:MAG: hypothetical protein MUF33_00440 [Candidatus Nanopelagicales bacterium]|jgi:hypothetical protein|nr:hypothetical protein [Candidatus Nanopelagicales bacterium]